MRAGAGIALPIDESSAQNSLAGKVLTLKKHFLNGQMDREMDG